MAEAALVERNLNSGRELLQILDAESDFPVFAALWLLRSESSEWTLYIGSIVVDTEGKHEAYARLQRILEDSDFIVPLRSISLVGSQDRLLSSLAGAIVVEGVSEIRVQNSMFNGVPIPDAVIYRLLHPPKITTASTTIVGTSSNTPRPKAKPTKRTNAPKPSKRGR